MSRLEASSKMMLEQVRLVTFKLRDVTMLTGYLDEDTGREGIKQEVVEPMVMMVAWGNLQPFW